jgi:hypothetical protein
MSASQGMKVDEYKSTCECRWVQVDEWKSMSASRWMKVDECKSTSASVSEAIPPWWQLCLAYQMKSCTAWRKKVLSKKWLEAAWHRNHFFTRRLHNLTNRSQCCKRLPWRRGAVDVASASGTRRPGSNPARVYVRFLVKQCNAVVCKWLYVHRLCVGKIYFKALSQFFKML